ncbi:unnamed protein product [Peniophora sp. CBMAI 1063]|nr:unnamed protein product [Peniophora sp. CBMAI 1063]
MGSMHANTAPSAEAKPELKIKPLKTDTPSQHARHTQAELNEDIKDEIKPSQRPDPWANITPPEAMPKEEASPHHLHKSESMGPPSSTSSRRGLKQPCSEAPLSSLSSLPSGHGMNETPDRPIERAHKSLRLNPRDVDVTMDDEQQRPQSPPRSPTSQSVAPSASAATKTGTRSGRGRTSAAKHARTGVKAEILEDDDALLLHASPPPDIKVPRASELPDVKPKLEELAQVTLADRLAKVRAKQFNIDLKAEDLEQTVHRCWISHYYGGGNVGTYLEPSFVNWEKHKLNDWLFIPVETHPSAPRFPGMPGIWFDLGHWTPADGAFVEEDEWLNEDGERMSNDEIKAKEIENGDVPKNRSGIWRLCIGLGGWHTWYLGHYQRIRVEDLTKDEWRAQTPKFRRAWASYFSKFEWGEHIRYRVKYRREHGGQEPTRQEFKAATKPKGKDKWKGEVTADEIEADFNKGKERLGVYVLNCVSFDKDFQKSIVEKNAVWEPKWQRDYAERKEMRAAKKAEEERAKAAGEIDSEDEKKPRFKGKTRSKPKDAKAATKKASAAPKAKPSANKSLSFGKGKRKRREDDDDGFEDAVYRPNKSRSRREKIDISHLL